MSSDPDLSSDKQHHLRVINIVVVILAVFFVGLRFLARWTRGITKGLDDGLLAITLVLLFTCTALCMMGIQDGLGRHAATLKHSTVVSFNKTLIAFQCFYVLCICCTKLSLLAMYCRIFPTRSIRFGAYTLSGISIAWATSIILLSIFQCSPIKKAWDRSLEGHCANIKLLFIANAIPNILTDVAILALPMPQVWKLQASRMERAQLSCILLLGSFVVFTSIYRFTTLFAFNESDATWTLAAPELWSVIELSSAIISTCLPFLSPLVQSVGRLLGTSSPSSAGRSNPVTTRLHGYGGQRSTGNTGPATKDDASKTQLVGSRPFHRLNEGDGSALQLHPCNNNKITSSVAANDLRNTRSVDSDEIPLHGIMIKTDVEWEERGVRKTDTM